MKKARLSAFGDRSLLELISEKIRVGCSPIAEARRNEIDWFDR